MDRQQILDLYEWRPGTCFRHPGKGEVSTTVVGVVHPRTDGEKEVRGCAECVITMEDTRRDAARRSGRTYQPGQIHQPGE